MTKILQVKTLILGGGLTGLSAAYHLEKAGDTDYLVVEKNPFFGGLCASETRNGFTFDYSGHLLHLSKPYTLRLVKNLLGNNLHKLRRKAFISFENTRVPFPFQANLWAISPAVRQPCLTQAQTAAKKKYTKQPDNFEQWCLQVFGQGIYKHFMKPYNQKLWQISPSKMTWDWCGRFVPKPDIQQIQAGAQKPTAEKYGYNTSFYYPLQGGCGALAEAIASQVPNTWLKAEVQHIDLTKKTARINGKTIFFEQLLNTLPLKDFIRLCQVPTEIRAAARQLKATTVHVLNFALNRPENSFHWMYFPQKDIPFYRVGTMSAFSPHNAPEGTSSFYVESAEKIKDFSLARRRFFKALRQKGIINKQDKILFSFWRHIPSAYAVYTLQREKAVQQILTCLEAQHCLCAGRYGCWEYSFMERSLLQGREAAEKLKIGL